mmetsp:Transcript_43727/g.115509  ORF Transcript_43727/g.115509 Transcript_43727/m.115509 type:complete len:213 (+) Transcript_43727:194-832(+)
MVRPEHTDEECSQGDYTPEGGQEDPMPGPAAGLVRLRRLFIPQSRALVMQQYESQRRQYCAGEQTHRSGEHDEKPVVALADTVVHKWAMMVESENAAITVTAMGCSRRTNNFASGTPLKSHLPQILRHPGRILGGIISRAQNVVPQRSRQLLRRTSRQYHTSPRYNARVGAACEQQRQDGQRKNPENDQRHHHTHLVDKNWCPDNEVQKAGY